MNTLPAFPNQDRGPKEIFDYAVEIGEKKVGYSWGRTFILAILAGVFIALSGVFSTAVAAGSTLPWGMSKLLQGLVFCMGLILVVIGGGELFTGNILIVAAFYERKIKALDLLRNWGLVYLGNFVGSLLIAGLMMVGKQYTFADGGVGLAALKIAQFKVGLGFSQAFFLGIACNILVCMAVWLSYSARTTGGKILAILFPVTAFVAAGLEHSVANMYLIPIGLLIKSFAPVFFWKSCLALGAEYAPAHFSGLTWDSFLLNNLLPVTIGNIIGGAVFVAGFYWAALSYPKK